MRLVTRMLACLAIAMASIAAFAQEGPFAPANGAGAWQPGEAELDQLLAPVALYPDALLGNILAASTYPLEVVSLHRWLERNPGIAGDAIESAIAAEPWAASVKALAPFRTVVAMMNGELDWMQRLGNAFLSDEAGVMDAVQRLRSRARDAGSLADNSRERVVVERDVIMIEPVEPSVVYVPVYDPRVVYGSWWWPGYPPYVWSGLYFGPWDYVVGGIYFGFGVPVWGGWYHHPHPDWHQHNLVERRPGAPAIWRHDPAHRGGVPYADNRTHDRYRPVDRDRVRSRQDYRGFEVRPRPQPSPQPANPVARAPQASPAPYRSSSPLSPMPNQIQREQSARGHESLRAPQAPAMRQAPQASQPRAAPQASQPRSAPQASQPRSAPPSAPSGRGGPPR